MKKVLMVLIPILTLAGSAKGINEPTSEVQSYSTYWSSIDGIILTSPGLIDSFHQFVIHFNDMDSYECAGLTGLYQTHFKGIVDYLNRVKVPAEFEAMHRSLVNSWSKFLEATGYLLKYCDTPKMDYIQKTRRAINEANQSLDNAVIEMQEAKVKLERK